MSLTKYPYMPPVCQVNNVDIDLVYSDIIDENIISINSKKELFFDIYECILNDEKLILEKVGESELGPKVLLELNIDGKKYSAEAILVDNGSTYVELNKENIYFIRTIPESNLLEEDEIDEPISDGSDDDKEIDAIDVNYENIIEHHVNNKLVFLHELEEQFEEKIVSLKDDISNKLDLFFEKLEDKKKVIVEEKLEEITLELDEKYKVLKSELHQVEDFSKQNIDNILETKIKEIDSSVGLFLEGITKEYKNKIISSDKKITHNFLELNSIKEKLKENNSTTNKKFTELNLLKEKLLEQDELVLKNEELKKFINEEFENINSKFKNLSVEENKKYEELLAAVNNKDVVEYKTILKEKIQDVELTQIKESLQEEISSALKGDIVSLKRYVEMSSGGGSTAKQFAAGGTMDGTLNVNGNILSGGTNLIDIFNSDTSINLQDVTDNGSTTTNLISSNNTIIANNILATNLLSATNLDIGFELSGFNVTGDLSASGGLSANNINVSGDILPSQTTTFNIGSTALRFKDIFLAGSTIDLSGTKISTDSEGDIEFRDKDNLTKRIKASEIILESPNDPDNDIVFKVDTTGNPEFQKRRRSNPNIIEPSTTISDIVSAAQVRVRDVVGIGTSPSQLPNKPLTVVGEISATGNISTGSNLQLGGNIVDTDANEIITIGANDIILTGKHVIAGFDVGIRGKRGNCKGISSASNTTNLGIYNCSIEAITIDTTGKVGIGTTTPNEALTVNGGISAADINSFGTISIGNTPAYSQTRAIKVHDNGTQYASRVSLMGTGDNAGPAIEFVTDGSLAKRTLIRHEGEGSNDYGLGFFTTNNGTISEKVRFDGDGNVGIGTTSPGSKLEIVGQTSSGGLEFSNAGSQSVKAYFNDSNSSSDFIITRVGTGAAEISLQSDGEVILNPNNNNVGIGTTTPNETLTVVGNISATGTTNVGKITLTENTFLTAASSFTLGDVHKGATVLLQNTGSINITVPSQVAGYTTTFIAETHNPVSFISGTGLSGLNSFNGASDIAGIYGQAQVIYKSAEYAFLGGNIV